MPLPTVTHHGARRCHAQAKHTGQRCKNPAAHGMGVCRMHGARRPESVKRGPNHPGYRHGGETLSAKAERSTRLAELRQLEDQLLDLGSLEGARWRGRKPLASRDRSNKQ
jgi:hypothetical protein